MKENYLKSLYLTLINVALNFGFKVFLAKEFLKEDLALYYTAIDIFSLSLLVLIGFRSSMVVTYAKLKEDEKIVNLFRFFVLFLVLMAWTFMIPYLKHNIGVNIHYWYLVAMVFTMALQAYLTNQIAMYRQYKLMNKVTFIEPVLTIVWFSIAYYLAGVRGLQPLFVATIMGSLTLSLFIIVQKRKKVQEPSLKLVNMSAEMKRFLKNSLISSVEFGSGMVMLYLAVILIMKYFSTHALGDFQVVVKPIFAYMVMLFVFPIFRFVLPELSHLVAKKKVQEVIEIKRWLIKLTLGVSALFFMSMVHFGEELITLLFAHEYLSAYYMLIHLSFFFVFVMFNAYQISFIKANGKFMWALLVRLSGIVILVSSFYILKMFSSNVVIVILALTWGYTGMFFVSLIFERHLMRKLKATACVA